MTDQDPTRVPRRAVAIGLPALAVAACAPVKPSSATKRPPVPPMTGTPTARPSSAVDWVVAENAKPGTGWRRAPARMATDDQLCGYATKLVVSAGEGVPLAVRSRVGAWQATVLRIGHYGGMGARQVWRSPSTEPTDQPAPKTADDRCVTAGWHAQLEVPTAGLPAGAYLVVIEAGGKWRYACFVIRSEETKGRLVLVAATTTYAAYNTWGGYSLYKGPTPAQPRAHRVSHQRPQDGDGAPKLLSFEAATMRLAEELGLPVAYLGSEDLEDPSRVMGATGIVSLGHDEYWSVPMRDNVTRARDAGTNLGFLGANACYWRVRLVDGDVVCYKVDPDPTPGRSATTLWRQGTAPEPENSLTGMLYECFPAEGDLTIHDADSFVWEGTGAKVGSTYAGIVGTEVDRVYPIAGTPASIQVLAHSPVTGRPGIATHADLVYYRAASGAGVIATGTMQWTWALAGPNRRRGLTRDGVALVRIATTNILRALATPRLGDARPPRPNLASVRADPSTRTGTGGAVGRA